MGSITYLYEDNMPTWTVPVGVSSVTMQAWGKGGESTGGSGSLGGSGGGAYSSISDYPVTACSKYFIYVANGSLGDFTTWVSENDADGTKIVKADRGVTQYKVAGVDGGLVANGIGDVKYAGGNGGNAYSSSGPGGGGGGGAGPGGAGGNGGNGGVTYGGTAGTAGAGGGGKGGVGCDGVNDPVNPDSPGGGAGGTYQSAKFTTYGVAKVIITWTDPVNFTAFVSNA